MINNVPITTDYGRSNFSQTTGAGGGGGGQLCITFASDDL